MTAHPTTAGAGVNQLVDALNRHADPALREIGQRLAGGAAPHQLLALQRHVDVLQRGLRQIDDLTDEQLTAYRAALAAPIDPHPGDGGVPAGGR
jgi:hypothetical protein